MKQINPRNVSTFSFLYKGVLVLDVSVLKDPPSWQPATDQKGAMRRRRRRRLKAVLTNQRWLKVVGVLSSWVGRRKFLAPINNS